MKRTLFVVALATSALSAQAGVLIVDTFADGFSDMSASSGFNRRLGAGSSMAGGLRETDLVIQSNAYGLNAREAVNGVYTLSNDVGVVSSAELQYGSPNEFPFNANVADQDRFRIHFLSLDHTARVTFTALPNGVQFVSTLNVAPSATPFDADFLFSGFTGSGTPRWDNLVGVAIQFDSLAGDPSGLDMAISDIRTVPAPEPAPLALMGVGALALFRRRSC